jgi:hypothetical protein
MPYVTITLNGTEASPTPTPVHAAGRTGVPDGLAHAGESDTVTDGDVPTGDGDVRPWLVTPAAGPPRGHGRMRDTAIPARPGCWTSVRGPAD